MAFGIHFLLRTIGGGATRDRRAKEGSGTPEVWKLGGEEQAPPARFVSICGLPVVLNCQSVSDSTVALDWSGNGARPLKTILYYTYLYCILSMYLVIAWWLDLPVPVIPYQATIPVVIKALPPP
jgi:hypothetical protein